MAYLSDAADWSTPPVLKLLLGVQTVISPVLRERPSHLCWRLSFQTVETVFGLTCTCSFIGFIIATVTIQSTLAAFCKSCDVQLQKSTSPNEAKSLSWDLKSCTDREKNHGCVTVIWCFKTSQPRRIIPGLRETFVNRYIVERTNKAEIRPEKQSEKTENLWNEIQ